MQNTNWFIFETKISVGHFIEQQSGIKKNHKILLNWSYNQPRNCVENQDFSPILHTRHTYPKIHERSTWKWKLRNHRNLFSSIGQKTKIFKKNLQCSDDEDPRATMVSSGGGNGDSGRSLPFLFLARSLSDWPACGFVMKIEERDREAFGRHIGLPSIFAKLWWLQPTFSLGVMAATEAVEVKNGGGAVELTRGGGNEWRAVVLMSGERWCRIESSLFSCF